MLAQRAEDVAAMLLPEGARQGREWCVGSLGGEAGASLKVHLGGSKAGVWADFATGESGDLLDLWAGVRGLTLTQAIAQVHAYLGLREHRIENPGRSYRRPSREGVSSLPPQIAEWLSTVRKISPETAVRFKLASRKGALMFPYLRGGELVAAKYRKVPAKEFFVDADCEPCLFGWQALTGRERSVVLCEGEMDALAFAEYGVPALSVPFGGGNGAKQARWIESEFDRLSQFDTLFLALDDDLAGQQATAEIVKRLGRERCRLVTLPRKDANACLMDQIPRDEIVAALSASRTLDPEQLRQASEFADALVEEFAAAVGQEAGIRLPWQKAGDQVVLRPEEVSIWLGVNGHGKSQGMGQVTLGALVQDYRCCVASMEFKPVKWLKRMVRQATATEQPTAGYVRHVAHWFHDKLWVFDTTGTAKVDVILEVFAYAARRYGVQFFLIDNLAKCGFDEDDYSGQKRFVDRLTDFAKEYSVHVALVHHMRKGETEDKPGGKLDAKGSGGITDMVDTCAVWWRNKPKERAIKKARLKREEPEEDVLGKPDALLLFDKQRNGECEPTFALWFDQRSTQFLAHVRERPTRFVCPAVADDLGPTRA
ncbi:toprim domain-containing protein [Lysobacter sp. A6]|uniref:Toprim domain-containing protein n=1 Tax=Noviluteimonas lactosilytica TaxID=2888523 RepID=A0ABS8JDL7_9GAMM|nr:toprim domain-containing protein [Lysobacter lactosilyticus]MCC8361605.1 toprim domain-containing protein [Lysobacter lactosilyticus]